MFLVNYLSLFNSCLFHLNLLNISFIGNGYLRCNSCCTFYSYFAVFFSKVIAYIAYITRKLTEMKVIDFILHLLYNDSTYIVQ